MKSCALLLATAVVLAATQAGIAADHKPNVLVIVADDLGYGEMSCQGFTSEIPTPQVDSIAKRGRSEERRVGKEC